jgi:hypothetical protein
MRAGKDKTMETAADTAKTAGSSSPMTKRATVAPARWVAAVICILYGFAKINGSQFTVLDSELAKPMGEVSGFWLTWRYFGYSPIYGNLIAMVQVGGAILLVLPRTSLIGALLLLPVAANIVLIDIFYGIAALLPALLVLLCLVAVIVSHAGRLKEALLLDPVPGRTRTAARAAALVAVLAIACGGTWFIANYNNRAPTAIDGVWSAVADERDLPDQRRWDRVFFEYNRAYLAVVRTKDGEYDENHFEVDDVGNVRMWETWLRKGTLLMQGRVEADGRIRLQPAGGGPAVLLQREQRK